MYQKIRICVKIGTKTGIPTLKETKEIEQLIAGPSLLLELSCLRNYEAFICSSLCFSLLCAKKKLDCQKAELMIWA